MDIMHLTKDSFDEILNSGKVVIVDFWATWCGPCAMMAPIYEELSGEYKDIIFAKYDVDTDMSVPLRYGIDSIPAILKFEGGKCTERCVGYVNKEQLKNRLKL